MDPTGLISSAKRTAYPYFELARPYNAAPMLLSFLAGYYYLTPINGLGDLLLGLALMVLLHSAWNTQNDIYDIDVDTANKSKRPLVLKLVTLRNAKQFVLNLMLLALVVAAVSSQKTIFIIFIYIFAVVGWQYNAPPLRTSRRPISSIFSLGLCYGLIPLLFGFFAGGNQLSSNFLIFAAFWTLLRTSISILKDYKDESGDKRHAKRTFLVMYGPKKVAVYSIAACIAGYTGIITLFLTSRHVGAAYMALVLAVSLALVVNRTKLLRTTGNKRLNRIFVKSFIGENYFGLAVLLCLTLS